MLINRSWANFEMQPFIVYGPYGYGKTSYSIKCIAEAYGEYKDGICIAPNYDWDMIKGHLYFHPKDFLAKLMSMAGSDRREKMIVWDDAGFWLSSYEWHEKFISLFARYLNVVRTHFSCVMFTTPTPTCVIKRIRGMPQLISIKIWKAKTEDENRESSRWARIGQAYRWWLLPDGKKSGVRSVYQDKFSAKLPDEVYAKYMELRRDYADMAIIMMKRELEVYTKEGTDPKKDFEGRPVPSKVIGEETSSEEPEI